MTLDPVENRPSETPEKSQTQASPTSKTAKETKVLSQARETASGPYKCDWCGQVKPGMRRCGARICRDCWRLYLEKKNAK